MSTLVLEWARVLPWQRSGLCVHILDFTGGGECTHPWTRRLWPWGRTGGCLPTGPPLWRRRWSAASGWSFQPGTNKELSQASGSMKIRQPPKPTPSWEHSVEWGELTVLVTWLAVSISTHKLIQDRMTIRVEGKYSYKIKQTIFVWNTQDVLVFILPTLFWAPTCVMAEPVYLLSTNSTLAQGNDPTVKFEEQSTVTMSLTMKLLPWVVGSDPSSTGLAPSQLKWRVSDVWLKLSNQTGHSCSSRGYLWTKKTYIEFGCVHACCW